MPRKTKLEQAQDDEFISKAVWPTPPDIETEIIAIDPGDHHVGVAFFARQSGGTGEKWYCQDAQQIDDPDGFELMLAETLLGSPHGMTLVVEIFRLYEDKAQLQKGSQFRTSQMIGAIKFIARIRNEHVGRHHDARKGGYIMNCEREGGQCEHLMNGPAPIEVVMQLADIKKPTTGILRHKKIKSVGKQAKKDNPGWGDHCIDAELHGWKHILDTLGGAPAL